VQFRHEIVKKTQRILAIVCAIEARDLHLHPMRASKKIKNGVRLGTIFSVCVMIFCLTYLTSLNYFLYSPDNETITQNANPSGPTEEKSSATAFSFAEEILHEGSFEFSAKVIDQLFLHHIAEAEKLQIVHAELLLRPPRA
jgi:hypothetical protein